MSCNILESILLGSYLGIVARDPILALISFLAWCNKGTEPFKKRMLAEVEVFSACNVISVANDLQKDFQLCHFVPKQRNLKFSFSLAYKERAHPRGKYSSRFVCSARLILRGSSITELLISSQLTSDQTNLTTEHFGGHNIMIIEDVMILVQVMRSTVKMYQRRKSFAKIGKTKLTLLSREGFRVRPLRSALLIAKIPEHRQNVPEKKIVCKIGKTKLTLLSREGFRVRPLRSALLIAKIPVRVATYNGRLAGSVEPAQPEPDITITPHPTTLPEKKGRGGKGAEEEREKKRGFDSQNSRFNRLIRFSRTEPCAEAGEWNQENSG
ncbi:hypothetical protein IEQ34_014539 [Dendrobium chrysotoxum]|uniref:Uncharacterized protein n=1 Tax=Dendrobium chrysotoxum TaxID=161865 RepID=A0AAV7GM79_DENCH|nr:hypothetical protein IEQ34_014539 [Dendrobium chrysotoxum]